MTRREKVLAALAHRSGPVPVDFGSTSVTGMHVSSVAALRDHYGLEKRLVKVHEPYQMLGWIEDDLLDAVGIDTTAPMPADTLFGFAPRDWKEWRTPWGQDVLVPGKFHTKKEGDDVVIYPKGDTEVPPSGRMPSNGYFFDSIIRQVPWDEENLDPADNTEEFTPISDEALSGLKSGVTCAKATGRAIVVGIGGTGFGDIALVPAPSLRYPKGIRDVTEWYVSVATRRDYVKAIFDRQLEVALANLQKAHGVLGDSFDVLYVCGTDFGTQTSQFCSAATFRELWLPYYRAINDWVHRNTAWKTFKHSCGAIVPFLPSLIEAGFDIINPVQCSATGMEAQGLKERFGDQIVFWGGGVDTQRVLPFGTKEEVRRQVLERCEIFAKGGGFVFDTIHNVQALTPVENLVTMFDAVREFNGAR
ncbi:MAG: methyltransferase [Verrucomicrobiae bacterium]|nr:methyltransferase [Verrucomicrobiae bacterium]